MLHEVQLRTGLWGTPSPATGLLLLHQPQIPPLKWQLGQELGLGLGLMKILQVQQEQPQVLVRVLAG